jgi:hypothetical protein
MFLKAAASRCAANSNIGVTVLNIFYWILAIVLLVVLAYAGVIRPTGLAGRTRAQEEHDRNRSNVARWLNKQDPEN